MYLFDFFKNLFKKNNIGIIIWLVLNVAFIVALFSGGFTDLNGGLLGFGLYVLSLMIALSPIGEVILRWQTGCKKITDPYVLQRIEPLFREVYSKALAMNPELPQNIKIFMSEDTAPNAFATGRKTLCITRGLLAYSDEHIKGVLGHEFGHLAHKDTDLILVVAVGNLIISVIFAIIRFFANAMMFIGQVMTAAFSRSWGGIFASMFIGLGRVVADFMLVLAMRVWTQIGVWLCMYSSRKNEYRADEYSYNCGYGEELCQVLESFGLGTGSKGLFAALSSSHPDNADRINKIRALGGSTNYLPNDNLFNNNNNFNW